ncbi:hypothetical protein B0A48_18674 [Cryoendolithus antarcticus]|uniref:BTB domain-containing protein n=1 Tax=Cryoendolithus antarcticus TaxID=1507870 RepID=A0A1V8S7U6_9PEZI|nr:hypothetical protein B0A48_18674 [Cryoendolithus antarcticus]
MASAGRIITQVQQGGPAPRNTAFGGSDENITLDMRGTRFTLSRDELLTLPEFVLLSLFPNGLLPDGQNNFAEGDVYPVDISRPAITQVNRSPTSIREIQNIMSNPHVYLSDIVYHSQYEPISLNYMLEFFQQMAQTIPQSSEDPASKLG